MTDDVVTNEARLVQYHAHLGKVLDRWRKHWLKPATERFMSRDLLRDAHIEDAATLLDLTYEEAFALRHTSRVQKARAFAKHATFGLRHDPRFAVEDFRRYAEGRGFSLRETLKTIQRLGTAPPLLYEEQERVLHRRPSQLLDNHVWEAFMRDTVRKSR